MLSAVVAIYGLQFLSETKHSKLNLMFYFLPSAVFSLALKYFSKLPAGRVFFFVKQLCLKFKN